MSCSVSWITPALPLSASECIPVTLNVNCPADAGSLLVTSEYTPNTTVGPGSWYSNSTCSGTAVVPTMPGALGFRGRPGGNVSLVGTWQLTARVGSELALEALPLTGRLVAPPLELVVGECTTLPTAQFVGLSDLQPVAATQQIIFELGTLPGGVVACPPTMRFTIEPGQSQTSAMPAIKATSRFPGTSTFDASQFGGSLGLVLPFSITSCYGDGGTAQASSLCCQPTAAVRLSDAGYVCP